MDLGESYSRINRYETLRSHQTTNSRNVQPLLAVVAPVRLNASSAKFYAKTFYGVKGDEM